MCSGLWIQRDNNRKTAVVLTSAHLIRAKNNSLNDPWLDEWTGKYHREAKVGFLAFIYTFCNDNRSDFDETFLIVDITKLFFNNIKSHENVVLQLSPLSFLGHCSLAGQHNRTRPAPLPAGAL